MAHHQSPRGEGGGDQRGGPGQRGQDEGGQTGGPRRTIALPDTQKEQTVGEMGDRDNARPSVGAFDEERIADAGGKGLQLQIGGKQR